MKHFLNKYLNEFFHSYETNLNAEFFFSVRILNVNINNIDISKIYSNLCIVEISKKKLKDYSEFLFITIERLLRIEYSILSNNYHKKLSYDSILSLVLNH